MKHINLTCALLLALLTLASCSSSSDEAPPLSSSEGGTVGSPSSSVTKNRLGALAPDGKHFIASLAMGHTFVNIDAGDNNPTVQLYMLPGAFSHVEMYENEDPSSNSSSSVLDESADMKGSSGGGASVTDQSDISHQASPDVDVYTYDSLGRITAQTIDYYNEDGTIGHAEGGGVTYTPAPAGAPRFVRFSSMSDPVGDSAKWSEGSDGQWVLTTKSGAKKSWLDIYEDQTTTFDAYGRPVKTEVSGSGVVSAWTYTGYGDAVVNFDTASSATEKFEYDTSKKILSQYDVSSGTEKPVKTVLYDKNGYVLESDYYYTHDDSVSETPTDIRVVHTTF